MGDEGEVFGIQGAKAYPKGTRFIQIAWPPRSPVELNVEAGHFSELFYMMKCADITIAEMFKDHVRETDGEDDNGDEEVD